MQEAAAAATTLDFRLLASWQRTVFGVADAPFRERPAFAKGGRERYGPLAQVKRSADERSSLLRDGYARIDA